MSDRRLVVAELDPADANHGKLYGLSANAASAIKIPAFTFGTTKPAVGTELGEAFYETTSKKGWVWDGTAWREIAASPLKTFATEVLLTADTAEPIGTYAIATDTGGLFVRRPSGWGYVGVKPYATAAALLADNTQAAGTLGEASDESTLWERTATGWRLLVVREMADTVAVQAWGNAAAGANPGDRVTDLAHSVTYIRTSAGWKPTTLWEDTEANIKTATWALNGQEAVATDTGRSFVRVAGVWRTAALTIVVSATAPTGVVIGQEWFDLGSNRLMICTESFPTEVWTPAGPVTRALSKADYQALVHKDPNTIYLITP